MSVTSNQIDLIVGTPSVSSAWDFAGDGSFGTPANWNPAPMPNGAGLTATFARGVANPINSSTVGSNAIAVTIDGAYTLGAIVFDNSTVGYSLTSDGMFGDGLTLSSASGSGGTSITVTSGNHAIAAKLTLADAGGNTFAISPGTSLAVSGAIGEVGGSQRIALSGGGTLTLSHANGYSGGTTVNDSTLATTANGALGTGPLAVNSIGGAAIVNVGGNESIGALSQRGLRRRLRHDRCRGRRDALRRSCLGHCDLWRHARSGCRLARNGRSIHQDGRRH